MYFEEYQEEARKTAIYSNEHTIIYPTLGLAGEAGEVAEKVKKVLRDKDRAFGLEEQNAIAKELGDVLWYVANLAADLGLSLETIAEMNLAKLKSRQTQGLLQGSGDNRENEQTQ